MSQKKIFFCCPAFEFKSIILGHTQNHKNKKCKEPSFCLHSSNYSLCIFGDKVLIILGHTQKHLKCEEPSFCLNSRD